MANRQKADDPGHRIASAIPTSSRQKQELPPPGVLGPSGPARAAAPKSLRRASLRGRSPAGASRAIGLALGSAWLVLGCVYDPGASGAGGGGGGTDTPTSLDGTDLQVCGDACSILAGCGAQLDQAQCKADCANNPGVVSCFRSVTPTCDPLASCVWSAVCNGAAPNGSQTCGAAESCAINCGGNADPLCLCGCAASARPDASGDFYVLVTCLNVRCGLECGLGGDAVSCDDCLAGECSAAAAQCN